MRYIYYRFDKPLRPSVFYRRDIILDNNLEVFNVPAGTWVNSMFDNMYEVTRQSGYLEDSVHYEEIEEDEVIRLIVMKELIS